MPVQHIGEWISEHLSDIESLAKAIGSRRVDPSLIEDLIQSAMVRLLQAAQSNPIRNPRAFLQVTIEGLLHDHFRKQRKEVRLVVFLRQKELDERQVESYDDSRLQQVERVRNNFSSSDLQLLSLHLMGAPAKEIAERTGITPENARQRLSRLLRKARTILGVPQCV